MDKLIRNLLIALAVLVILTPIGLISTGETFGEWGNDYLEEKLGYVPAGLESVSVAWNAPLPDYGLPFLGETFAGMSVGYILSAIVGVALCGGLLYLIGKLLAKRESDN